MLQLDTWELSTENVTDRSHGVFQSLYFGLFGQ